MRAGGKLPERYAADSQLHCEVTRGFGAWKSADEHGARAGAGAVVWAVLQAWVQTLIPGIDADVALRDVVQQSWAEPLHLLCSAVNVAQKRTVALPQYPGNAH